MKISQKILNIFTIISLILLPMSPALAIDFNPNYVLSDDDLTDFDSMDAQAIQGFLGRKGGYLASYETEDTDGVVRKAADIIYRICQTYLINPKFILALIQKEQSLVEDPNPTQKQLDWAAGYSVCDSCTTDDPAIQRWKGFAKQIRSSAMQFMEGYLLDLETVGRTVAGISPGEPTQIDGQTITPFNNVTAALYTYTPHIHGNENMWKIWQRWFTTLYPDGSLLQVQGEPGIWLIKYDEKRPFLSMAALLSRYDLNKVIQISKTDLDRYETGRAIKFADYSLLRSPRGTIFLLDGDKRRGIDSWETFRTIGFNPDEIIQATWEDVNLYDEGEMITLESVYPQGALLQNKQTGGVYWVQDGKKYPIWSKELMYNNFQQRYISAVSEEE
ncbi:hypothetical protein KJ969_04060, partial [Patescibacteria group bacterium]|nr:hypothetical protein [Patescibacteria group bacterium]MBU1922504.1 hypothetical protein [Patescibacteria group bacterium]